jgi:hypothetical protein
MGSNYILSWKSYLSDELARVQGGRKKLHFVSEIELKLGKQHEAVVRACMDAGLVKGDASRYHGKAPDEIDWSVWERQTRAVYVCPADKLLTTTGNVGDDHAVRYRAPKPDCGECPLKPRCCPNTPLA